MENKILIRKAIVSDASEIHDAHMQSIREVCSKDHSPEEIKAWGNRSFDENQRMNAIKNQFVYVVLIDEKIVGFLHYDVIDNQSVIYVFALYLTLKATNRGIGSKLMNQLLLDASLYAINKVELHSTLTAHHFYKKLGFTDIAPMTSVKVNGVDVRCIPMFINLEVSLKIDFFKSAIEFVNACEEFLLEYESFYNLKLGLSKAIKENMLVTSDPLFIGVYNGQTLTGCAVRTNIDRPLAISKLPLNAISLLVKNLFDSNINLIGVVGELNTATVFKDCWSKFSRKESKIIMHLGVYENSSVLIPSGNLKFIIGTENEKNIILNFIKEFMLECFPETIHKDEDNEMLFSRLVKNKSLFLLQDSEGIIVAMAANTRGSKNGGCISLVYTPKKNRGKGYGSLVTVLVTEKILNEKRFACLFTDLANPTSNSIYQKIGYKKIGENIHFNFH
jgi:predicted GNAT family acetyltransferase